MVPSQGTQVSQSKSSNVGWRQAGPFFWSAAAHLALNVGIANRATRHTRTENMKKLTLVVILTAGTWVAAQTSSTTSTTTSTTPSTSSTAPAASQSGTSTMPSSSQTGTSTTTTPSATTPSSTTPSAS